LREGYLQHRATIEQVHARAPVFMVFRARKESPMKRLMLMAVFIGLSALAGCCGSRRMAPSPLGKFSVCVLQPQAGVSVDAGSALTVVTEIYNNGYHCDYDVVAKAELINPVNGGVLSRASCGPMEIDDEDHGTFSMELRIPDGCPSGDYRLEVTTHVRHSFRKWGNTCEQFPAGRSVMPLKVIGKPLPEPPRVSCEPRAYYPRRFVCPKGPYHRHDTCPCCGRRTNVTVNITVPGDSEPNIEVRQPRKSLPYPIERWPGPLPREREKHKPN